MVALTYVFYKAVSGHMTSIEMSKSVNIKKSSTWELLEEAAKRRYGNSIRLTKTPWVTEQLDNLNFEVSVLEKELEPKESNRTIVDINMKEYTNRSRNPG